MSSRGPGVFKRPTNPLERIASVRFTMEDVDLVNQMIVQENRQASEIIRDAVREYHANHHKAAA